MMLLMMKNQLKQITNKGKDVMDYNNEKVETVVLVWQLLRDYISHKERAEAAEHLVALLQDELSYDKRDLAQIAAVDHELSEALDVADEDAEEDLDQDTYDYDND